MGTEGKVMTNFEYAIPFILEHEGGWCHTPGDSGGETYAGVSRNNFPNWQGWEIIDSLKSQPNFPHNLSTHVDLNNLVDKFYQENFWFAFWDQLDKRVSAKVMDISVNCGILWGPRILQTACSATAIDGYIGPRTIALANAMDQDRLLGLMVTMLDLHYEHIVENHPEDKKFLADWERRAAWIPS